MRASEKLCILDCQCLNNNVLYCLLQTGIFDWTGPDTLLNQAQQAVHLGTATSTRCMEVEFPYKERLSLSVLLDC